MLRTGPGIQNRILIKSNGRRIVVETEEIDQIQSEGNYVRIHVGDESYLYRATMNSMEKLLGPADFVRTSRSVIANLDKIKELRPLPTGEYVVLMKGGKELTLSRHYRHNLRSLWVI